MSRDGLTWTLVVGLAIAHFLLHVGFGFGGGAPDLLSVSLLVAARQVGMGTAGGLGFFFGILEDSFSVLSFGSNALSMTVVGIVGSRTRDLFVGDSALFLLAYFGLGAWLRIVLRWIVSAEAIREPFLQAVLIQGPALSLYAAVFGLLAASFLGVRVEATR